MTKDDACRILLDCTQQHSQIEILAPNEGTRYLGIYISPNGASTTMETHLWKKAVLYTKALQCTHMSRREAGVLYRSCFLPAIVYPFPATWLQEKFLDRILRLSTPTILNKMGLHRNLPRSMVFAPRAIGGVGLCNLTHEHAAQQLLILIRHLRAKTPLGHTLEMLVHTYQLWTGQRQPILEDTSPCPWIPDKWLTHLCASMNRHSIQVTYNAWTVPALRLHDRFLMDDFKDSGLPRFKLECLNTCRMYLQVTLLSEITDHTGEELLPQTLTNYAQHTPKGLSNISTSRLQWPDIHLPSKECWSLWSNTIRLLYMGSNRGVCLQQPLGAWTTHYDEVWFWHWRLHDTEHLVHQNHAGSATRVAIPTLHRRTFMKFSPTVPTTLPFVGPPVTPSDPTIGHVRLPIPQ